MGASPAQGMTLQPESQHFVVSYKRLERGRFRMPRVTTDGRAVEADATELAMLLDGIDVRYVRRPEPWRPKKAGSCTQGIDKTIAV
jgi:transposase